MTAARIAEDEKTTSEKTSEVDSGDKLRVTENEAHLLESRRKASAKPHQKIHFTATGKLKVRKSIWKQPVQPQPDWKLLTQLPAGSRLQGSIYRRPSGGRVFIPAEKTS